MSENVIFKDEKSKMAVTDYRFVVKNTSYSITQIVSVSTFREEKLVPARKVRVDNAGTIEIIRSFFIGAIILCVVVGFSSEFFIFLAAVFGIIFYLYWLSHPLERTVPASPYVTYSVDVTFSNGFTFQYTGEEKSVESIGKALNSALCRSWHFEHRFDPLRDGQKP